MKIIDIDEDTTCSAEKQKKVRFTIQLDDTHFVDIMIAEESGVIYTMENEDGTVVYDSNGTFHKKYPYSPQKEKETFACALSAFQTKYERKANVTP